MGESFGSQAPRRGDPSVFVAAPLPQVFAYLSDPCNRPAWQRSLRRVELIDANPPHVGQRWTDHLYGGLSFELSTIALEPGKVWAEMGRTGPVTAFVTMLFSAEERDGVTGTLVRTVVRLRGQGAARVAGWLGTGVMGVLVRLDLPQIKKAVEG